MDLTTRQTATLLGYTPATIRVWRHRGKLPATGQPPGRPPLGTEPRHRIADILTALDQRGPAPHTQPT